MDNRLKPYDGYKETENDWLSNIPSHWKETSIRGITKLSNKRNRERTDLELLSVYREYGVIKKKSRNDNHNVESEDLSSYKYVNAGYLVLNKMKMWQGSLGVSKYEGIVSPAYIVCKLNTELNTNYISYLLRAAVYKTIYNRLSYGVRVGQWDMRYDDFKSVIVYIPPKGEQDQIVKYLDWKLSKINKFIKAKKRQIELLKEQKQAIIREAVTKGLDPNAKMKPTNIEWLGNIPERWDIKRLKSICRIQPTINLDEYSLDDLVVFLPMENISEFGNIDNSELRRISEVKSGFTGFAKNDVLVAKITPCFENGKGACLDNLITNIGYGTTELIVLRASEKVLPKFLYYITRTSYFRILGAEVMTGSAGQKRVPVTFISNFTLGIPDVEEQSEILTHIEKKSNIIDSAIEKFDNELKLITEYRTSLISDVVTGKVDVRNIVIEGFSDEDNEPDEIDESGEEASDAEELDMEGV